MRNRHWLVVLGALWVAGLLPAGPARATDYTTTQITSLMNGDTINTGTTPGSILPLAGHGLYATGAAVNAPGGNTITTGGSGAHGIFLNPNGGSTASTTATGTTININGDDASGVVASALAGDQVDVTLTGVTINSIANDTGSNAAGGVSVTSNGTGIGNLAISNSTIVASGNGAAGVFYSATNGTGTISDTSITVSGGVGVNSGARGIYMRSGTLQLTGTTSITATGAQSTGIGMESGALQLDSGVTVTLESGASQGDGILGAGGTLTAGAATITAKGEGGAAFHLQPFVGILTANLTGTSFTTHGQNAVGFWFDRTFSGANNTVVSATGVTIATTNAGAHALLFQGNGGGTDQVTFDATSKLSTSGAGAHIVSVQQGATQTIDTATGAGVLVLPSTGANISVTGAGSALAQAQDAGSVLTIKGTGLPSNVALGSDSWGVIADNGGKVLFSTAATTQGYSLWARGTAGIGTIEFQDTSTASTSRVKVDTGGLLDLTNSTIGNFPIASLEGTGGNVNLGTNTLQITGSTVTTYAGVIGGTGGLERNGTGTTVLTGTNTYTGGTTIASGATLQLGANGTTGSILGDVSNDGTLIVNRSNAYDFTGTISGSGGFTQAGTGTTTFNSAQSYTGPTTISNGTLMVNSTLASAVTVDAAGTLGGVGTINNDVTNAGAINPGSGSSGALTIAGNYIGNGGSLLIQGALAGNGTTTNQLVIQGAGHTASGSTAVLVTNLGGVGGQTSGTGIPIILAEDGATTGGGAFALAGRVTAGPFEYLLKQGSALGAETADAQNSWYLVSHATGGGGGGGDEPLYRGETAMHAAYGAMARQLGLLALGTFHDRNGDQRFADTGGRERAWGRIYGQRMEQSHAGDVRPSFGGDFAGLQSGVDLWQFASLPGHRDNVGMFVAFTDGRADVSGYVLATPNSRVGSTDIDATSLGGYWSHIAPAGWYTDAVVMGTLYDGDGHTRDGSDVGVEGSGVIASLEGGFTLGRFAGIKLQPQAQVVYQYVNLDEAHDPYSYVAHSTPDALHGRLGLRLEADQLPWLLRPYLKANVWQDFVGSDRAVYDHTHELTVRNRATTLELGGGFTAQLAPNVGLWASADYSTDIAGEEQERESVRGNVGLRIVW